MTLEAGKLALSCLDGRKKHGSVSAKKSTPYFFRCTHSPQPMFFLHTFNHGSLHYAFLTCTLTSQSMPFLHTFDHCLLPYTSLTYTLTPRSMPFLHTFNQGSLHFASLTCTLTPRLMPFLHTFSQRSLHCLLERVPTWVATSRQLLVPCSSTAWECLMCIRVWVCVCVCVCMCKGVMCRREVLQQHPSVPL